jgi:hypothetical protein
VVAIDTVTSDVILTDEAETAPYERIWEHILEAALTAEESAKFLTEAADALADNNDTNPATAGDGGKAGQRNQTAYVFYTSAPLTAGKTVQGITLPAGGTIPASGRISGMHIFARGIGPLNATGQPVS